jgi:cytochrome c oxidase cbb3-type subunit IV
MDYVLFSSVMTVVVLVVFVGIVVWAWSAKRRAAFDAAARVPLEDEADDDAHHRAEKETDK